MSDKLNLVITDQYQRISHQWNSCLKMGESIALIFPYLSDKQFRIQQYLDSLDRTNFSSVIFNPSSQPVDELSDLENLINQQLPDFNQNPKKIIILSISEGELLLHPGREIIFDLLQKLCLKYLNIKTLIAFDNNIFKSVSDYYKYNLLFQNIIYYPLYSSSDIMVFIDYLCKKWELKMPQPVRKSITYHSGGFYWLTKEACRLYRDNNKWSPSDPSFLYRLNCLYNTLTLEEKDILSNCPRLKKFEKSIDLEHLKKIGLINQDNLISVPELSKLIIQHHNKQKIFSVTEEGISLNGFSLSNVLSATEYALLKFFISKPNIPITRDEIAKIMWPLHTEDSYSQWAIDQAIKRLRDRLVLLKLSPFIIKSVRGVGYEFKT